MKSISLSNGKARAIVDDTDYEWLTAMGKWCISYKGYAIHYTINEAGQRKVLFMHRLILQRMSDRLPPDWTCDHIDRNRLNNRRANLRCATRSQQQANKGMQVNNQSGYRGVWQEGDQWMARIQVEHERIYLGSYETAYEASLVYDAAQRHFNAEFAGCNHPSIPTTAAIQTILLQRLAERDAHRNYVPLQPERTKSPFRGVCWDKSARRWKARLMVNGKQMSLGYFDDDETAARAYDRAARKHLGEKARLNFEA